jgi:hypothetical protein
MESEPVMESVPVMESDQDLVLMPENEPEGFSDNLNDGKVNGYLLSNDNKYNGCGIPNDEIKELIRLSKFNDISHQRYNIPNTRDHPHIGKNRPQFHPQKIYNFH